MRHPQAQEAGNPIPFGEPLSRWSVQLPRPPIAAAVPNQSWFGIRNAKRLVTESSVPA
jgi:hypothetical protein